MWEQFRAAWRLRQHRRQGIRLYQQGRFQDAAAEYRAALALGDNDPLTHYNLGLALYKAGQKARAREHWQTALSLSEGGNPYLAEQVQIVLRQFG